MAGVKALVGLAFLGSIGLLLVILACALPGHNFYPLFMIFFYILAPIPTLISRRSADTYGESTLVDACAFLTAGIVLSAFALPTVLVRAKGT